MDLQSKVGQMFFIGLHGTGESDELREYLDEVRPGGIVLFSRNLQDPAQVRRFNAWLSTVLDPSPFIALDQEGGRVNRLSELIGPMPPAASFATAGGEERLEAYARQTARALKSLGFNMDFAPCVDLSAPGAANGIGDRAFSTDPATVSRLAGVFVDAMEDEGVATVLKHFPGLGPTDADTHQVRPSTDKPVEALWTEDLLPFRDLMGRTSAVMIGHAHYAAVDTDREVAATLSTAIVGGLLRKRMGFDGLAITDDMEMGAVAQEMTPDELHLFAVLMGADQVLWAGNTTRILNARRGMVRAIHAARLYKDRIDHSIDRIMAVKDRLGLEPIEEEIPGDEFDAARTALLEIAGGVEGVA